MKGIDFEKIEAFADRTLTETFSKIFMVNINTGDYKVYRNDGLLQDDGFDDIHDAYAYMQKLITDEIIYPEYATVCRRFTNPEYVRKSVFSGEKRIVQSYRRRTVNGDKWITFAIIAMSESSPENPYVLFTWREADSDAITLLDTLPTISSLYDKLIRINLSNNTYEPVIVDADEQERLVGGVINMYEWWAGYSKDGNIAAEDMGAFSTLTRTGSLQKRFSEDPTPVNFRYRRKIGDEYRWVQLQISPSVEYSEENQIMLLSLKDVHEEYEAEILRRQALIDNMNRDALTKLFNRLKYNEDIDTYKNSSDPIFTCLYIDVNGLHELNNILGHQKGDDMLCCVADTLKKYFPDDRVYRIGGDEFVVLSTNITKGEAELAISKVRSDLIRDNYAVSVGIASGSCGAEVATVIATAELEMRNDKEAYYLRNGDRRKARKMNEELEEMLVEKRDSDRFLRIITRQFIGVYFVDLNSDIPRHVYIPEFFAALLKETGNRFSAAMRLYVEQHIYPQYHDRFHDILDYDKLDKTLAEVGAIQFTYEKDNDINMSVKVIEVDRQPDAKPETLWIFAAEPLI